MPRQNYDYVQPRIDYDTVTIASGQTVSTAIQLDGMIPIGIIMPAAFTGTAMKFQFSQDDSTFTALYNVSGNEVSITVGTSRWIGLDKEDFYGAKSMKLVSGSTEAVERTITIVLVRA